MIQLTDFQKLDLRIGEIVEATPVPGTEKLLQCSIDLGNDERVTTVAGIALSYSPEQLVGKQVVVLANLEPVTLRGVRSQGMVLAAGDERTVSLLVPDRPIAKGSKVR
jgi:methionine--tRNA ligase beta chain